MSFLLPDVAAVGKHVIIYSRSQDFLKKRAGGGGVFCGLWTLAQCKRKKNGPVRPFTFLA